MRSHEDNNIEIDWNYYKNEIPIEDVVQELLNDTYGINTEKSKILVNINNSNRFKGKCCCPFHNDTHPSGYIIREENYNYKKGQYGIKNFFYCPVDNICANPIDLVKKFYNCSVKDAVLKHLAVLFPDGISKHENYETAIADEIEEYPYIQPEILQEIGFRKDPFKFIKIKDIYKMPNKTNEQYYKIQTYKPEVLEICDMLIDKFLYKIEEVKQFNNEIINKYPDLKTDYKNALLYIKNQENEKIKKYTAYIGILQDYIQEYEQKYKNKSEVPWDNTLPIEPRTREYSNGLSKTEDYGQIEIERMTDEEKIFFEEQQPQGEEREE